MELNEFIKHALLDDVNGVEEANKEKDRFRLSSHIHHGTNENNQKIQFDISVIVNESSENDVNGGIKVALVNIRGGEKRIRIKSKRS